MRTKYVNRRFNPRVRFWLWFFIETLTKRRLSSLVAVRLGHERLTVCGLEYIPQNENFVLAVNHFNGRPTFDTAAAVLGAVSRTRSDVSDRLLFVVGRRERPTQTRRNPIVWLFNKIYARWSEHMVSVPLYNTNPSLTGLREWRERGQPVFVFPEGKARLCLGRMRRGSGRWLSWLDFPVIPVAAWWERDCGWHVHFGKPITWSRQADLRDLQLGLAMASLLPPDLAPDWQIDLQRWRNVHARMRNDYTPVNKPKT